MSESVNIYTLFDQAGRQIVASLWLPSLEALLLGFLVWALLKMYRGFSPRVRHFLWVLVLVKPLVSLVLPWHGPVVIPWSPAIPGSPAGITGAYYAPDTSVFAIAGLIWIAFAGIGLIRITPAFILMSRRRQRAVPVSVSRVRVLFDQCLAELEVKKAISLRVSDEFPGPALITLGRPVVVIPSWCILDLSTTELKQVLLHELAHFSRRDHLTVLLVHFCRIFFFFHPAVWYAARRIGIEAERACDADVLRVSRQPERYASTLLRVAGSKEQTHWQVALELARSASLAALRIRDVLGSALNQERGARFSVLIMAICALLAGIPLFRPTVVPPVDTVSTPKNVYVGPVSVRQVDPASISLDVEEAISPDAVHRVESRPVPTDREVFPRTMVDGRPWTRSSAVALIKKPYLHRSDGDFESVDNQRFNPAALGLSSASAMLDRTPSLEKGLRQGRIEVQGVGQSGTGWFHSGTVSLSAGYFITPIHQFGGVFSIRRPNDGEAFGDAGQSTGTSYGTSLLSARKLPGFTNNALTARVIETEEEEQVEQITRIGAFYRYNVPVPGESFPPFFGCGTGLELRPRHDHRTIVDAGVGLRYFWARHAAVVVQASYRKELDVTSGPHPEMSLGFSAIF